MEASTASYPSQVAVFVYFRAMSACPPLDGIGGIAHVFECSMPIEQFKRRFGFDLAFGMTIV